MLFRIEDFGDVTDQFVDLVFEFPFFAFGAVAPGGRVQDDAVVLAAAVGFALDEFEGVFDQPADVFEFGLFHIRAGPGNDLLDGVTMDDICAGRTGGQGSTSGVSKQIENFSVLNLLASVKVGYMCIVPSIFLSPNPYFIAKMNSAINSLA